MTCREFTEAAEALTPSQLRLMQAEGDVLSAHAGECAPCGRWLESQRLLGSALQVLRDQTAGREAGPKVEQAVLQAFRMQGFEPVAAVAPERAAPAAWKLSRFFEVGAYAAVAAALIVGVFLGEQMWRDRHVQPSGVQAAKALQQVRPDATAPADSGNQSANGMAEIAHKAEHSGTITTAIAGGRRVQPSNARAAGTDVDRQGFVALMFCDPLICSGEEQVIRMELPGNGAASAEGSQPVIADVVVGDDGLVRAMRIVN